MEQFYILWVCLAPIIAFFFAADAKKKASDAQEELRKLAARLAAMENHLRKQRTSPSTPQTAPPMIKQEVVPEVPKVIQKEEPRIEIAAASAVPPALPIQAPQKPLIDDGDDAIATPPPLPSKDEIEKEPFSLERFMGVKLFAWLGGIAMFFGVILFVKYAFEKNLIPPAVRVTLGFLNGIGLLVGGLLIHRRPKYQVLGQAFCATGVVILYGVTYAAHAIYHFPAFGPVSTMIVMSLITLVAFLVAVRLNALVVAVLGMLGGFLTPVLVSSGKDEVFSLFGYIALLDIGLLAVSLHGRWRLLATAAALGTALTQLRWHDEFFTNGRYFLDNRIFIPMGILLFFIGLFTAGSWWGRMKEMPAYAEKSVLGLAALAMAFAFSMISYHSVAERYVLLYGFILLIQVAVLAVVMMRPHLGMAQVIAALLAFLHLAVWSRWFLTSENLLGTLALYLVFGAFNAVIPVVISKRLPAYSSTVPMNIGPWFAPLSVLMMVFPLLHLSPLPMLIWPAILIVDLLVIALAAATRRVLPVLASLVLTMAVAALWLQSIPREISSLMPILGVISGFSLVFAVAGKWLTRGMPDADQTQSFTLNSASTISVCSGILPYALLVLALLQLPVLNPTPVFGVALLMTAILSTLAIFGKQGQLVLAALISTLAVESVWHAHHFRVDSPMTALSWYLGFYALFLVFPFVFRKACAGQSSAWIASALSGVGHFLLIHDLVKRSFPNELMGLVPFAFAIPSGIALWRVIRMEQNSEKNRQLAWFGGVTLLFITLIFPIQFDRQWITVSWALEGAALLWLFRRVPHPGLQLTGLTLLTVCFVRMAMNPAVITHYPRSGTAIFNWHLYAYGIVAASQFFGAWWFTDKDGHWDKISPRNVLYAFCGILLFLLLNIEIADYFTQPGARFITFRFGGNFACDMTYSIAWGLFSLGLLGIGIWKKSKHARFAAIGLLIAALLKVFLHDLAMIESIFRIGALVGVAVIAFIASFLYQRFFDRTTPS